MLSRKYFIFSAEIIVLAIVLFLVILFVTDNLINFINLLYSPFTFIIVILMGMEFVVLRILDRSKLLRLQIKAFRRKRKRTLAMHRELLSRLNSIEDKLSSMENKLFTETFNDDINWLKNRLMKLE